ncbi:MAG TPA: NlpC-P60 family protein, partial [Stenotrophomonas sp.]|nr:NlpC-P60 family protein [Stenotrophomonas sp.]
MSRAVVAALLAASVAPVWAEAPRAAPSADFGGVIALREAYLSPGFWADRLPDPDRVILDRAGIAAQ